MKKIYFINQKQVQFASPWREKISNIVVDGRKIARQIAEDRKNGEYDADYFKTKIEAKRSQSAIQKGRYVKNTPDPLLQSNINRKERLQQLRDNKAKRQAPKFSPQPKQELAEVNDTLENKFKKETKEVIKPSSPISANTPKNNPVKIESHSLPKTETKIPTNNTSLLKPKRNSLGKVGLGAVGLLTAGGIGYGIYRKLRSDKGKKRGAYKR